MKKTILIVLGILLIVAAAGWKFGFSQRYTDRYSDGWAWDVKTIGLTGYPDEATGQYAPGTSLKDDPINLTTREVTAEATDASPGDILISDHFQSRDTVTNEVTWDFTSTTTVDAVTGRHIGDALAGDYYFFPRNVDKNATYVVSNSSYKSLAMTFQREEAIAGVETYLFAFHGDLDNTEANAAYVTLKPNEVVTCFDFSLEYWVEPVTGEIVKYREWCEGDWIVNKDTGERISTISRWGGETSGDDIIRQVTNVQNRRMTYLWASLYGPLAAAVIGIVLIGFGALRLFAGSKPQES